MTPAVLNFTIQANGWYSQVWQINSNDVAVDLTGYTFRLTARTKKGVAGHVQFDLTTGSGLTINDAVGGKLLVEIAPDEAVRDVVVTFYDLLAIKNGKEYVWIQGRITINPGATYEDTP